MHALTGVVCFCVARGAGAGPSARVCVPWTGLTGGGTRGATESPRLTRKTLWCVRHPWERKMTSLSMRNNFHIIREENADPRSTSSPSICMFFKSTGLAALEPSVTLLVLQYRILVPEFRLTWSYEKDIRYYSYTVKIT